MLELNGGGEVDSLSTFLSAYSTPILWILTLAAVVSVARHYWGGGSTGRRGPLTIIAQAFTTNWQLTLLATTAFVLSVASGWTTWDGMRNFTGEPVLSFMITFGIQGVMLIIAWLIGESFAAGIGSGRRSRQAEITAGSIVGALVFIGLAAMVGKSFGLFDGVLSARSSSWLDFADKALLIGLALLIVVALLINQKSDVIQPYLQSARVMAKNAVLWIMFLACMATSVFFSFDSLFSSIFPKEERARAADIRANRQIAGVVADIGDLAQRRQVEEAEELFESEGWLAFEKNLVSLSRQSEGAAKEIERFFEDQENQRNAQMAALRDRIAGAQSDQANLAARKVVRADELARLTAERPTLAADLLSKKNELDSRARGVDAKRVEMMAEERGAEGTLKVGRGPMYRQRKAELDQLQDAYKIQETRVSEATTRLATTDTRIAELKSELAMIDAEIAKLKGAAETAAGRIAAKESSTTQKDDTPKVDPARVRTAFERAQNEFRRKPTVDNLNALVQQCSQLHGAMASTDATRQRVSGIDCDPKQAMEAASRVFALNAGLVQFANSCAGGDKLPTSGGTDAMLEFGRKCLQDSGLPSRDSGEMAAKISAIDLNRDDKAHRFVVTWNAFTDGNRLAYLALAIAIAIDSLVFMSGLFGANALRSPLSEIEDRGERTADELEEMIDATLAQTAHPSATLLALLNAMHPVHARDNFTSEVVLDERDPLVSEMRMVLSAGARIGAVRPVGDDRLRFHIHTGLGHYLALAQNKSWKVKSAEVDRKELVNVIGVALLPDPQHNADAVLSEMHPISDSEGYAAETKPFQIADESKRRLVMNTLGAGATVRGSVKREDATGRYFVSTEFYKTLLMMRAAAIPAFRPDAVAARYGRALSADGSGHRHTALASGDTPPPHLQAEPVPQITDQTHRRGSEQPDTGPSTRSEPHNQQAEHGGQHVATESPARSPSVPTPLGPGSGPKAAYAPPPVPEAAAISPGAVAQPAHTPPPPPKPVSSQLASQIRAEISQFGLHPWTDWEVENAARSPDAHLVDAAMRRLIDQGGLLGRHIQDEVGDKLEVLDEAYEALREQYAGNSKYLDVLESEIDKLKRALLVLMTSDGGPYDNIAQQLRAELRARADALADQAGAGRLTDQEMIILENLEDHVYRLRGISKSATDRHKRIAAIIDGYREGATLGNTSPRNEPPQT